MQSIPELSVQVVPVTPFAQNCSIIMCTQTHDAIVVDPGGDIERIMHSIRHIGANVTQIALTHGHLDHAAGAPALAATKADRSGSEASACVRVMSAGGVRGFADVLMRRLRRDPSPTIP